VVGLYAAPGALIPYAALGSSRHLVVGPMSATAALSAAAVAEFAAPGADAFTQLTLVTAICTEDEPPPSASRRPPLALAAPALGQPVPEG